MPGHHRDALVNAGCTADDPFVKTYVFDVKMRLRSLGHELENHPFKRAVALDVPSYRSWLYALWADPALKGSKKLPSVFRSPDMALFLDGRSPGNFISMTSELTKVLKDVKEFPARKFTTVRRMYSNMEFSAGGYAAPVRTERLNPKTPDPLENLILVFHAARKMPYRLGAPCKVPDNRSRGWYGIDMKSPQEQEFGMLTVETYEAMLGPGAGGTDLTGEAIAGLFDDEDVKSAETAEEAADAGQPGVVEEAAAGAGHPGIVETADAQSRPIYTCPWEGTEEDYAMLFKLHAGPEEASKHKIVNLGAGSGPAVLAAVRAKQHIVCFAETEKHKIVLFEQCLLKVVTEVICGKADGFVMGPSSRLLSRQGSLTGQEPGATERNEQLPTLPPSDTRSQAAISPKSKSRPASSQKNGGSDSDTDSDS
jgi:hypothetical protein